MNNKPKRDIGQSLRLEKQHKLAGGPLGIFGEEARSHDLSIRVVMEKIAAVLKRQYPNLVFRHRQKIPKKEIHSRLASFDERLGKVLFVREAAIKPDGGVLEVLDHSGRYRVILVSESKHQGNDVQKIRAGIKQGKRKDQDIMNAGNAIERVHKNIQEVKNMMLDEIHFPYVVFLQGSNFATTTFHVETPDGRVVEIAHDAGNLNRIDRVTASSFGMEINRSYCRNIFIQIDKRMQMLQVASFYFQSEPWATKDMAEILCEIALTSLDALSDSLPSEGE